MGFLELVLFYCIHIDMVLYMGSGTNLHVRPLPCLLD